MRDLQKKREYNKRYYQAHLEYFRSYQQTRDPAKIRERNRRYRSANREKVREYDKQWKLANPEKRRQIQRQAHLKKRFGMTLQEFDSLLAKQKGVCAICKEAPDNHQSLRVDHDHTGGDVRGLLCNTCNRAIGLLKDDPAVIESALEYLRQFSQLRLVKRAAS